MKSESSADALIPAALLPAIQAAAEEDRRPPGELVREALERYLEDRRWQRLVAYGHARAEVLGLTDSDLPGLIAESRQERRRGH
jgi:hypothetical protein